MRKLLLLAASLSAFQWAGVSAAIEAHDNLEAEWVGKIAYTRLSDGGYRGEESWRMSVHPDGSRTMRITKRIDDTQLFRDVVLRVDARLRPIDSYQSLWKDGKHRGSAFYVVDGDLMRATVNAPNGILTQSVRVPDKFSFVARPQAALGWHLWYFDFARGGTQTATMYTLDRDGLGVGSILATVDEYEVVLVGEEQVTTAAGTFDTWRLVISGRLEMWIDKRELLMIRLINASADRLYELVELSQAYSDGVQQ
jgi:hypothetical protein